MKWGICQERVSFYLIRFDIFTRQTRLDIKPRAVGWIKQFFCFLDILFDLSSKVGMLMINRSAIAYSDSSFCTAHLFLRNPLTEIVCLTSFAFSRREEILRSSDKI